MFLVKFCRFSTTVRLVPKVEDWLRSVVSALERLSRASLMLPSPVVPAVQSPDARSVRLRPEEAAPMDVEV